MMREVRGRNLNNIAADAPPGSRPLQDLSRDEIAARLKRALDSSDGAMGAHCIHELWMRGEMSVTIERALERLWACAAASVPEWLPMRYIDWLPIVYEIALEFRSPATGRANS
jgi:hypothetical protein